MKTRQMVTLHFFFFTVEGSEFVPLREGPPPQPRHLTMPFPTYNP